MDAHLELTEVIPGESAAALGGAVVCTPAGGRRRCSVSAAAALPLSQNERSGWSSSPQQGSGGSGLRTLSAAALGWSAEL